MKPTFHIGQKDFRGWIPLYRDEEHVPSCHVYDHRGDGERLAKLFAASVQLAEILEKVEDFLEHDTDAKELLGEIQEVIKLTTT